MNASDNHSTKQFSIGDANLVVISQDSESEIDEVVADMFLNWFYSKATNGSQAQFTRMETEMTSLFGFRGW